MSKIILVIDDEPIVLQVVSLCLRHRGYQVLEAATADASIALAESGVAIDLVFADSSISETAAHPSLVSEILERQPNAKILRCSGKPENFLRSTGQIRPASFFLQKPFLPVDLNAKVASIIGDPE